MRSLGSAAPGLEVSHILMWTLDEALIFRPDFNWDSGAKWYSSPPPPREKSNFDLMIPNILIMSSHDAREVWHVCDSMYLNNA